MLYIRFFKFSGFEAGFPESSSGHSYANWHKTFLKFSHVYAFPYYNLNFIGYLICSTLKSLHHHLQKRLPYIFGKCRSLADKQFIVTCGTFLLQIDQARVKSSTKSGWANVDILTLIPCACRPSASSSSNLYFANFWSTRSRFWKRNVAVAFKILWIFVETFKDKHHIKPTFLRSNGFGWWRHGPSSNISALLERYYLPHSYPAWFSVFLTPATARIAWRTIFAKTFRRDVDQIWKHAKSVFQPLSLQYSSCSKHLFALSNLLMHLSSPTFFSLQNLGATSIVHSTYHCFNLSDIAFPDQSTNAL